MSGQDFATAVRLEDELELVYESDTGFIVKGRNQAGFDVGWALRRDDIEGARWDDLRGALTGRRALHVLQQYTRIVGYYSNLAAWNGSKIAELADRHKGDYAVN